MVTKSTRHYKNVSEYKRIQVITLRDQQYSLRTISKRLKVKEKTVQAIIRKWGMHHTIQDLPKAGGPSKVSDRDKREMARMI
jgi:transposase